MSEVETAGAGETLARSWFWRLGRRAAYPFLITLVGPASDVLSGRARPVWFSGLVLGGFVACFAAVVETAPSWAGIHSSRVPSILQRRLHRSLVVLLSAIAALGTASFGMSWWSLFIFVAVCVALTMPIALATSGAAVVTLICVASQLVGTANGGALGIFSSSVNVLLAAFVALLLRRGRQLITELRDAQGEVARLAAADAVAEERLRFARDLHDLLGHSLSVIVLKAELCRKLFEGGRGGQAQTEVSDVEQIARRSLEEVREAVTGYRGHSLRAELQNAKATLTAAGIEPDLCAPPASLPRDVDELLGRIVREAATNIVRHSLAKHVAIDLSEIDGSLRLDVRDDGPGTATPGAPSGGSGLIGLKERVLAVGGRFAAGSQPEGGFAVIAQVPLAGSRQATESTSSEGASER